VAFITPAVAKRRRLLVSINLFLIRSLKLNQLAAIFFAGIALAQGNQRHAIKTTENKR
jgi:hypothetical protein